MRTLWIVGLAALPLLAQQPTVQTPLGVQVLNGGVVKNAPFSADAVTETTQALADGNRISQKTTQKLYRDSDGRERHEESVLAAGALAQPNAPRLITISDPVQNASYTLDPRTRTAQKTPGLSPSSYVSWLPATGDQGLYRRAALAEADAAVANLNTLRVRAYTRQLRAGAKEDLGTRNIEGVIAQGSRTTETIPSGQIGNQLPIKVVDEAWYSSELQMNVMTIHSDPRSGETTYKLTNIQRGNPPRPLFEPPPDYTVVDTASGARGGAPNAPAGGRSGGRGGPGNQK